MHPLVDAHSALTLTGFCDPRFQTQGHTSSENRLYKTVFRESIYPCTTGLMLIWKKGKGWTIPWIGRRLTGDFNIHIQQPCIQGVKKLPGSPLIPSFNRHKETNPFLFSNVLSPVLNNPFKSVHSIVKDALDLIECEVISGHCNCLFNFIIRMKLSVLYNSFQHPEEPKVARAQVSRIGLVRQSCNVILVES
jgi:hypothetical protein